jgi:pathogenesis-related protein 1
MHHAGCLVGILLAFCGGCAASPGDEGDRGKPAYEGEELEAFARELVDTHNDVRQTASPAPSPVLTDVTWSESVAEIAQAWAERCVFEHSMADGLGENLAFIGGDTSTGTRVVQMWASEAADYDYGSNACAPGRQCGHYTQIVWRSSTSIGCGAAECTVDGFAGVTTVCNYEPPGNFIGERPY